jgi:DNA-binding PadR family transcriptional regulator
MEHPYLAGGIAAIFVCVLLYKIAMRNHVVVGTYEYLEVLSYHVWKTGREIREDIGKLKGGWVGYEVYSHLEKLEEEKLIERKIRDPEPHEHRGGYRVHEFRLTSSGIRRTEELERREQSAVTAVANVT